MVHCAHDSLKALVGDLCPRQSLPYTVYTNTGGYLRTFDSRLDSDPQMSISVPDRVTRLGKTSSKPIILLWVKVNVFHQKTEREKIYTQQIIEHRLYISSYHNSGLYCFRTCTINPWEMSPKSPVYLVFFQHFDSKMVLWRKLTLFSCLYFLKSSNKGSLQSSRCHFPNRKKQFHMDLNHELK